jgi:hypothetical protein
LQALCGHSLQASERQLPESVDFPDSHGLSNIASFLSPVFPAFFRREHRVMLHSESHAGNKCLNIVCLIEMDESHTPYFQDCSSELWTFKLCFCQHAMEGRGVTLA